MKKILFWGIGLGAVIGAGLFAATSLCLKPVPHSVAEVLQGTQTAPVLDRNGVALSVTYQDRWNGADYKKLYEFPEILKKGFVFSEDRRFYVHEGVDWQARLAAAWQNIKAGRVVRGASTMTEQVVRMLHPRPRSLWSKWLEGFEAQELEKNFSKHEILEFYLNEIPFGANRRGVVQAARYYFDRPLTTLSKKEMLALVVLARAPSGYDLYKDPKKVENALGRFVAQFPLAAKERNEILSSPFTLQKPAEPVNAAHFIRYVRSVSAASRSLRTTLDAGLQVQVQAILNKRIENLQAKQVGNAAALVVDHMTDEVLAWTVAGSGQNGIDAVMTPRQPGSSLKPFLYALALEQGWTAATLIDDSPLSEAMGGGLHRFKNYSNHFYGSVSLREALGNSLNIPAVRTIRHVGVNNFLDALHRLEFKSLDKASGIYDEGLALGNGEVTLFELVQGYTALAHRGVFSPLKVISGKNNSQGIRVYSDEASSLIGNILSDASARRLEFGANSILNLPTQTVIKTGTSNDYRDAWAVGYNDRYVVGVWMGNLDRKPMNGITGSIGPALALRSVFAELNRFRTTRPLYLSPLLVQKDICINPQGECLLRSEYFVPGTEQEATQPAARKEVAYELVRPTHHLQLAYDPRIPRGSQKFRFELNHLEKDAVAEWVLNDVPLAKTTEKQYLWALERGKYKLSVIIHKPGQADYWLPEIRFIVK